ncbi:MAG: hypothetical protein JWN34_1433 [Bryobacterales bacterium]|jgi:hypothetical protein|nr:hypothetical protein [Bryobacterales bacterium]
MRTFNAKLEAAVDDGPWIEIAAGPFQPGAPVPLDVRGEAYPGAVTDDFIEANKEPKESGTWDTTCGTVKYRVSWS